MKRTEFPESSEAFVGQRLQLDWGTMSGSNIGYGWHLHFIHAGARTHQEMQCLVVMARKMEIAGMDISDEEKAALTRSASLDWFAPESAMENASRRVRVPYGTILGNKSFIELRCYDDPSHAGGGKYDAYMDYRDHPTVTLVKWDGRPGFRSNGLFYPFIGFQRLAHHRNVIRNAYLEVLSLP